MTSCSLAVRGSSVKRKFADKNSAIPGQVGKTVKSRAKFCKKFLKKLG